LLPQEIVDLGRGRAAIALSDRQHAFEPVVKHIQASAVDRGMYVSGITQERLGQAIREQFEVRALALWRAYGQVVDDRSLASDDSLGPQLKHLVAEGLDSGSQDIQAWHKRAVNIMPGTAAAGSFEEYREVALARVDSEVDLAVLRARRALASNTGTDPEVLQLKPQLYGVGVDLKALWHRIRRRGL
jgi:hypothetical protein